MISSTKPSRPINAEKEAACSIEAVNFRAQSTRNSEMFMCDAVSKADRRLLIHFDPDDFHDAFEICIIKEADFNSSFAFAIFERNFGSEMFLQPVLQGAHVNVRDGRRFGCEMAVGLRNVLTARRNETFGFPNAEPIAN